MFQIDPSARIPIYEQIINNVIKMASLGVLKPGDKLPPVRILAQDLGINPNTAAKAYRDLENKGYIYSTVGRGSFLSEQATQNFAQKQMAVDKFTEACREAVTYGATKEELVAIITKITG